MGNLRAWTLRTNYGCGSGGWVILINGVLTRTSRCFVTHACLFFSSSHIFRGNPHDVENFSPHFAYAS